MLILSFFHCFEKKVDKRVSTKVDETGIGYVEEERTASALIDQTEKFIDDYGQERDNILHLSNWIANAASNIMPRSLVGTDGQIFRESEIVSQIGCPEKFLRRLRSEVSTNWISGSLFRMSHVT